MKMYEVGGCIRDEILGVRSKDIDFTVVLDTKDRDFLVQNEDISTFEYMASQLDGMGFKIFLETPEFLTIRAQFPKTEQTSGCRTVVRNGLTADFVLARKESSYTDGRRPDIVEPGTLEDDLARRDFTMNAIAKDSDGSLIDPFDGFTDISNRLIRAVGDPRERLLEDALRAVRALRFSVTKNFRIEGELMKVLLFNADVHDAIIDKIADERIAEELSKMFRFDTVKSLMTLNQYPALTYAMFAGSVSLDATMKTKGRGK